MPIFGNKTLNGLTDVEKELLTIVSALQKQSKPKEAAKLLGHAKNIIGKALQTMPSDSTFNPVRKAVTVILNTVSGLQDGLAEGISRTDFKNAVGKLKTRFVPEFRQSLDALTKKLNAQASRLDEKGLLQSEDVILEELRKVCADLKRLSRLLKTHLKAEKVDGNQVSIAVRNRLDLVQSMYGMLPSGKDLDPAAETLARISNSLNTLSSYAKSNDKIAPKALKNLDERIVELDKACDAYHRLVVNNLATLGEDRRPSIESLLKRKLTEADKEAVKAPLVRSPDEHLKSKITEIKSQKASLPKRMTTPYTIIRSPIVAIFDAHDGSSGRRDRPTGSGTITHNFSKGQLLDQYGIKYVMLEDYVILQDQMLLAIDRKAVERAVRAMGTRKRSKSKVKGDHYVEYANGVVNLLNERGSQSYGLVSSDYTANPRNADMLLFWVMPSRILDALIRRGWNKLSQWSLPFDS